MNIPRRLLVIALAALPACAWAGPPTRHDLWSVFELALHNDPAYRQALETARASGEVTAIARGALLPAISLSADASQTNQDGSTLQSAPLQNKFFTYSAQSSSNVRDEGYAVSLTQTLFNWGVWSGLSQANAEAAEARATLASSIQSILLTVAQDYFNVLYADDLLAAQRAARVADGELYALAKEEYRVGLQPITNEQQARAAYDLARAGELSARLSRETALQALAAVVGRPLVHLAPLVRQFPLLPPRPNNLTAWVDDALTDNPTLIAAREAARAAHENIGVVAARGLPSLSLTLSHQRNISNGTQAYSSVVSSSVSPDVFHGNVNLLELNLSWPIYSGGQVSASVSQARAQYRAQTASTEVTRRSVLQQTHNDFLSVLSDIAQVRAYRASVLSNRTALKATEEGYKVGTQTITDVLTARQNLLTAEESYAQSRYLYLEALLSLEADAGRLTPASLLALNRYLRP
jgi:outer membrane protein